MKKIGLLLSLMLSAFSAQADSTYMVGLSYTFGGDFGITAKALSDDEKYKGVASLGATYYPFAEKKFGVDLGAGFVDKNMAGIISWDFLQKSIQVSGGYADTDDDNKTYTPAPAPAPALDLGPA